jgi:cytochrome c553
MNAIAAQLSGEDIANLAAHFLLRSKGRPPALHPT